MSARAMRASSLVRNQQIGLQVVGRGSRRPSGRPARSYSHAALTHLTFATSSVARGQLGNSETKGQQDITEDRATLAAHAAVSGA